MPPNPRRRASVVVVQHILRQTVPFATAGPLTPPNAVQYLKNGVTLLDHAPSSLLTVAVQGPRATHPPLSQLASLGPLAQACLTTNPVRALPMNRASSGTGTDGVSVERNAPTAMPASSVMAHTHSGTALSSPVDPSQGPCTDTGEPVTPPLAFVHTSPIHMFTGESFPPPLSHASHLVKHLSTTPFQHYSHFVPHSPTTITKEGLTPSPPIHPYSLVVPHTQPTTTKESCSTPLPHCGSGATRSQPPLYCTISSPPQAPFSQPPLCSSVSSPPRAPFSQPPLCSYVSSPPRAPFSQPPLCKSVSSSPRAPFTQPPLHSVISSSQSPSPCSVSHSIYSQVMRMPLALPITSHSITTPLDANLLQDLLQPHHCPDLVTQLVSSMRFGFRIGYTGPRLPLQAPNLSSAYLHPAVIDKALEKEILAGRVAGPFSHPPFPNLRCSGLGLVPKDDTDWRLIFHLSAPAGLSVNDYISQEDFSLQYHTIDDAVSILVRLGPGALMAKADLKSAFRLCPVHPLDWPLLGICWRQQYFVDKCLPFGLRSSPFLFNQLADALQWCLSYYFGVSNSFHYLDDFFFAGSPSSLVCHNAITHFQLLCDQLGVPLKPEKLVLPTTKMTFLGIHLDSTNQIASIPHDKMAALLTSLRQHVRFYTSKQPVTKRSLLSLIGKLSFATKVIPAGRIFLRRLLDLAHSVPALDAPLHLTEDAVLDINWWLAFAQSWNGEAFFLDPTWTHSPEMNLFTDASSEIGYGAFWNGHWFQQKWSSTNHHHSIQWKELYAILIACEVWGHGWTRKRVLFHCDNQTVVYLWRSGMSKAPTLMHLVRALFFVAARHNFHVTVTHIAGTDNGIADALSRFHLQRFAQLAPDADPDPTPIPARLTFHSSAVCSPSNATP